jgi:catechol 2,3-dioxygenase-like lactoylglutathione lyase family enzyme
MAHLSGFHHVKIPVSDVAASRAWYERVLGLETAIEFNEGDAVMGVALVDPARTLQIALRVDQARAGALAGFDPVALMVPTRDDVERWRDRLDDLNVPHGGVVHGHDGGSVLIGLCDPDGIELRLYAD